MFIVTRSELNRRTGEVIVVIVGRADTIDQAGTMAARDAMGHISAGDVSFHWDIRQEGENR